MCSVRQELSQVGRIWNRAERDIINSPEVCNLLYDLLCLPSVACSTSIKCIIATGICREPVVRVTFVIKKIKGLWIGQILLASFQWVKAGRVLCALPEQKFPNKTKWFAQQRRADPVLYLFSS